MLYSEEMLKMSKWLLTYLWFFNVRTWSQSPEINLITHMRICPPQFMSLPLAQAKIDDETH
jgi:hypothetical protein